MNHDEANTCHISSLFRWNYIDGLLPEPTTPWSIIHTLEPVGGTNRKKKNLNETFSAFPPQCLHLTGDAEHRRLIANRSDACTHTLADKLGTARARLVSGLELWVVPHDRCVQRCVIWVRRRTRIES